MLRILQPRGRLNLGAYSCPLCHGIHIASRRYLPLYRRCFGTNPTVFGSFPACTRNDATE
jgi:hypothetical protein